MLRIIKKIIFIILFFSLPCFADDPILFFSDLTDGPNVGLTDDQVTNQGAIVTIWGKNLGSSQGESTVSVGSGETWANAAHVYYWGNADGTSNGTHADLYTKQGMQEISFAIAATTATGSQFIKVTVGGASTTLPFYVRDTGDIFFVKTTGNDTSNGSWSTPWLTIGRAVGVSTSPSVGAGDIVYVCDGISPTSTSSTSPVVIGASAIKDGSSNNMIGLIAYPGATVTITSTITKITGIKNYYTRNDRWVISKLYVISAGSGIELNLYGRIIGNKITGNADGQGGALTTSSVAGDGHVNSFGFSVLGNHIHDYGSSSTSNLHHTTYFSVRGAIDEPPLTGPGFTVAWNRFENNAARFGIHIYDENGNLDLMQGYLIGSYTTPIYLHSNWMENQSSACINVGTSGFEGDEGEYPFMNGDIYAYNNVMINCGLTVDQGIGSEKYAIHLYGSMNKMNVYLYNNLIYGYGDASGAIAVNVTNYTGSWPTNFVGTWTFQNNIVVDSGNYSFTATDQIAPTAASKNIWYNGGDSNPANPPAWDTSWDSISANPLFTNAASGNFTLQAESPAINNGTDTSAIVTTGFDGIGRPQGAGVDLGIYEKDEGGGETDTTPPSPSIAVTGLIGDYETYINSIVVTGACTDNVGPDVLRIKEDSVPTSESDGAAFTSPYTLTLTSSGAKSVHLRCWDAANNSNTAVQNIYFRPVSIAGGGMN